MAETVRTLDDVLTQIPVGVSDGTSAQDIRDAVWSMMGRKAYVAKTSNYTATEYDHWIDVDATSGAVTITLPAVATARNGKEYIIRKTDTTVNPVIIDGNSSETIESDTTQVLFTLDSFAQIVNKTTLWRMGASRGVASGRAFIATAAATVASSSSETTMAGSGVGSKTLPANFFRAGRSLRVEAFGYVSNTGTPDLTIKLKFGSTVILTTGTITTAASLSNTGWSFRGRITCRTTGAGGTVMAQGELFIGTTRVAMVNTAAVTVDTTASQAVDLTAQWSVNSSSNTITCQELNVEITA